MKGTGANVAERRHRFKLGQLVSLTQGFGYPRSPNAIYKVVALLPQDRTHFQYRIRSVGEAFDRVASENELTAREI
jgi:hypothetical protein